MKEAPGSMKAREAGCTCPEDPVPDNAQGKAIWQTEETCPLHGKTRWAETN